MLNFLRAVAVLAKWKGYLWAPHYLRTRLLQRSRPALGETIDVIVSMVDHFEPSRREGEQGVEKVRMWCENYALAADAHRDADGMRPQHSWFYRYDYPSDDCLRILSEYVFRGFGEIEFHLHHGHDTPASFAAKLREGVQWFNRAGAMLSAEPVPQRRFAYIAGNWALDNGRRDDSMSGVNTELAILREAGCYADFTFPAFGMSSQPRMANAIYYATDDPAPKSYATGTPVRVGGQAIGDLMIVTGPLYVDWRRGRIEYAAYEAFAPYTRERLDYWLRAGVHVAGRPEWIFIKLHTHGMQSRAAFEPGPLGKLFEDLEAVFNAPPFRLHYVTARETYNIVKAAEGGHRGNPGQYRDYLIKPPVNRCIGANRPYVVRSYAPERVAIDIEAGDRDVELRFRTLPLRAVRGGRITQLELTHDDSGQQRLDVAGSGDCVVEFTSGSLEAASPSVARCRLPASFVAHPSISGGLRWVAGRDAAKARVAGDG